MIINNEKKLVIPMQSSTSLQTQKQKLNELILVVKTKHLFPNGRWQGLKTVDLEQYKHIIEHKKEFLPRYLMEQDQTYKQIIPYLVFTHNNKFFLMQRQTNASEKRLRNKYSLGIGGHIRQEDMQQQPIFTWAQREFHEEINYQDNLTIKPFGILNDDSNAVGKVHLGLVLLLHGDSDNITIKSELKSGTLATLSACTAIVDTMESWSQLILPHLKESQ